MDSKFKKWAKDTSIKAVRTMAQTAVGLIGTNAAGLCEVNWLAVGSASLVAGIVCVLMAISQIETTDERGDE